MIEAVARFVIEVVVELVFLGLAYWTGWVLLMVLSAGRLPLGNYGSWQLKAISAKEWFTIWRSGKNGVRELKAEVVCAVGVVFWLIIIIWLAAYLSAVS